MMTRKVMTFFLIAVLAMACRSNAIKINVAFEKLTGLQKSDRVLFQGNKAGHVKEIHFNPDGSYRVLLK